MSLTPEQVAQVADLARLSFEPQQLEQMTQELDAIVAYVEQLAELDTDGVAPMAHAIDLHNVLADDEVRPSLDRERALANAPKRDDQCYLVPPVL